MIDFFEYNAIKKDNEYSIRYLLEENITKPN